MACVILLAAVALAAQGRRAAADESAPAAPTITSFSPTSGKFPDFITITGTNFSGATQVTIGGVPSAKITVVSPTQITALVRSIADTGPVTVTTMRGHQCGHLHRHQTRLIRPEIAPPPCQEGRLFCPVP